MNTLQPKTASLVERIAIGCTTEYDAARLRSALYSLSNACDHLPIAGVPGPIDALQAQVQRLLEICFKVPV